MTTATFTVQAVTPGQVRDHFGTQVGRALRSALPFDVEVYLPPESRTDYMSECRCVEVYRTTNENVLSMKKRGLHRRDLNYEMKNPCVCACMGRLKDAE